MRRSAALALVGVLLVAGACAHGSSADTDVLGRTYDRSSVEGVVRRAGAVVAGAEVVLGVSGRATVTDASGLYRFDEVDAGTYRLTATDPGDDSPVCEVDGTCITRRSARHATVDVVVGEGAGPVRADVDL